MKETANIWEYKVGINAIISNLAYCRKGDKRINHESKLLKPKACLVEGAIYVYTYIRLECVANVTNLNH